MLGIPHPQEMIEDFGSLEVVKRFRWLLAKVWCRVPFYYYYNYNYNNNYYYYVADITSLVPSVVDIFLWFSSWFAMVGITRSKVIFVKTFFWVWSTRKDGSWNKMKTLSRMRLAPWKICLSGSLAYDVTLKTFLAQPHQLSSVVGLYRTECTRLDPTEEGKAPDFESWLTWHGKSEVQTVQVWRLLVREFWEVLFWALVLQSGQGFEECKTVLSIKDRPPVLALFTKAVENAESRTASGYSLSFEKSWENPISLCTTCETRATCGRQWNTFVGSKVGCLFLYYCISLCYGFWGGVQCFVLNNLSMQGLLSEKDEIIDMSTDPAMLLGKHYAFWTALTYKSVRSRHRGLNEWFKVALIA